MNNLIQKYKELPVQIKASFWFFLCAFLQKAISSITTPIFTRLLTTTEYGQFNVFISWLNVISIIVSLNLWSGVYMQGMVKYENEREQYSSALQGLVFVLTLIWTFVYIVANDFWNSMFSLSTIQMLCLMLQIWLSSAYNFWAGEQRVDFKYQRLVIITILVAFATPTLGILAVIVSRNKVTARIVSMTIAQMIFFIGCFISQIKRGRVFYSYKYWKYALSFNLPLIPHYLSMSVLSSADRIMISKMCGESYAGIYSLAYSISLIMTMFTNALVQTIEPWIYKKIKFNKTTDIGKAATVSFLLIALVNILFILLAPDIVIIFAPEEYYDAIWIIPPVAMSIYFMFSYSFFATFEFYYEKTLYITVASVTGAMLNILLNLIFIPAYGYCAAGYTTLVCYMLYAFMHFCFMKRICKVNLKTALPYNVKKMAEITLLFLAAGFVGLYTYGNPGVRYTSIIFLVFIAIILWRKVGKQIIYSIKISQ